MLYQHLDFNSPEQKDRFKFYERLGVIVLFLALLFFTSTAIIGAGERGIVLRLGSVNRVLEDGFHFKLPILEKVNTLNIQTQKEEVNADSASKDLQIVTTSIALNYNLQPENVGLLWAQIGKEYQARIIMPAIQEAVKAATSRFTAEELITQREKVREEMKLLLTAKLSNSYIDVTDISIVNFNFSPSFNEAIEKKVTAEQDALASKNKLEQVKFEAEQRITQAKGEAEAIRIQAEAIQSQGGAEYVNLKAIEKWNGVLPVYTLGESIPLLNLNKQ